MTETDQAVDTIIKLLKNQASGISATDLDNAQNEYKAARKLADEESKDGKLKDTVKANYTKVFKALPDLANGADAAIKAFKRGDNLGGAIAVVNICGTTANLLSSMAAASSMAGPVGAALGAVFAITSIVLKSFEPAQKSMGDIIEEKLRQITAESKLETAGSLIENYEHLYLGYLTMENQEVDSTLKTSLAEGPTVSSHKLIAEWLKNEKNTHAEALGGIWLEVLMLYLYATTLQLRNLAQLMNVIRVADRKKLNMIYKGIVGTHLKYMKQMYEPARDKGTIWHIGVRHGALEAQDATGGHIYQRLGANGPGPWKNLGGEQTSFTIAKADGEDVHHLVGLEGGAGVGVGDYSLTAIHKRAYLKSLGGDWTAEGTKWQELKDLKGCRCLVALPGDQKEQIYVLAIQNNRVTARMVTQAAKGDKAAKIEISDELESGNAAVAGETLLSLSVMPGYRPKAVAKSPPPPPALPPVLYLLKGTGILASAPKKGQHQIQLGVKKAAWHLLPPWALVQGMVADASYLWVWSEDSVARLSHKQIGELADRSASEEDSRKAWEIASAANKATWKGPTMMAEGSFLPGLGHLATCSDGTLVATFNRRLYRAAPFETKPPVTFGLTWKSLDPDVEAVRVLKEPIDCWPLFEKLYETFKKGAADNE